jgi:hypothetical protein
MLGAAASHRSVTFSLCPACAKAYDRTGWGLMLGFALFVVVGFALLALFGWLLG